MTYPDWRDLFDWPEIQKIRDEAYARKMFTMQRKGLASDPVRTRRPRHKRDEMGGHQVAPTLPTE